MKHLLALLCASIVFAAGYSEEATAKPEPFRVCVLDFTNADIAGQDRFLNVRNRKIEIPKQETLNAGDRLFVSRTMQGVVRLVDALNDAAVNMANVAAQAEDNQFDRAKALDIYQTVVKGEARPIVLGGEYLSAYLGARNDLFQPIDASQVATAMKKLAEQPEFPVNFQKKLAREAGVRLLIYGTVSDFRSREQSFQGYGIETKNTTWQLDVIVKVVDLEQETVIYSNVYTGTLKERQRPSASEIDHNRFQTLMDSALKQAAEDLIRMAENGFRVPIEK